MAATESSTRAMAALDDLYRRHVGDVYRYTYAVLGNHADAEDVTQTTFVNALRALERGEQPREPSHWLLAIAHNLVRQRWRQAAARPAMVELVSDVPDEEPDEGDIELDELVRALQRIPSSQREALVMRELEGRSYKEIGELLGLTTSALETLLFRARRSLAEELENIVTCQDAELLVSRQSDGRLSRKEKKRLDEHIAECSSCARFSRTQAHQRRAFKGLAMLPVPVGLALFRDVPTAAAAGVATIGETGATAGVGVGAGGAAAGGSTAGGTITVGGTVAGGSLLGGAAVKIAAVVAAATVAIGVGVQGVKTLRADDPGKTTAAAAAPANATRASETDGSSSGSITAQTAGLQASSAPGTAAVTGGSTGPKPAVPTDKGGDGSTAATPPVDSGPTAGGAASEGDAPQGGGSAGGPGSDAPDNAPGGGNGPGNGPSAPPGDPGPPTTPPAGGSDSPSNPPPNRGSGAGAQSPSSGPTSTPGTAKGKAKGKGKAKKPKADKPPKDEPATPPKGKPSTPAASNGNGNPAGAQPKEPKAPNEPNAAPKAPKDTAPTAPAQPTPPPTEVVPPTEPAPAPSEAPATAPTDDGNHGKGNDGDKSNGFGKPAK